MQQTGQARENQDAKSAEKNAAWERDVPFSSQSINKPINQSKNISAIYREQIGNGTQKGFGKKPCPFPQ